VDDVLVGLLVVDCDDYVHVLLGGEVDLHTGKHLRERLLAVAAGAGDRPLVLDLCGVAFCDSTAPNAVSALLRQGVSLALVGLEAKVARVFRLLGIGRAVPICVTVEEALWCLIPRDDLELWEWLSDG
jgi:anti-sigma B factor antagonist